MRLKVIDGSYSVLKLEPTAPIPESVLQSQFYSISKTSDELSIVCEASKAPNDVKIEKGWSLIKVIGPLDFSLTGILASMASPLAKAKVSIFAISTFDTDYLLVKEKDLATAVSTLKEEKFNFI